MTQESESKILSSLLGASRKLAECAADGDWDRVAELQLEQHDLLAQVFAGYDRPAMTAQTLSGLAQVRVYTDMVVELAKKRRNALASAATTVKTGRSAVSAYAECT